MHQLPLFLTAEHECSYLGDRLARSLIVAPEWPMDTATYGQLVRLGFRRSGNLVYRPHCRNCSACVPLRLPVDAFQPDRSQRRNLRANADLEVRVLPAEFRDDHYDLYGRYLRERHPEGEMTQGSRDDYLAFLVNDWCEIRFVEFRAEGRLLAVAVIDELSDGISAVYTFFEPEQQGRGLGSYAILWQIRYAQSLGVRYVYLGYWIAACRKMTYKNRFQPSEAFVNNRWVPASSPVNAESAGTVV